MGALIHDAKRCTRSAVHHATGGPSPPPDEICWLLVSGPTPVSVLHSLTQARLVELARELGISIPAGRKDAQIAKLIEQARLPLPAWLGHLVRDELRAACRELGLDASSRSRSELAGALLEAAGLPRGRDTIPPIFEDASARDLPRRGDIVVVRHRQYLVDTVHAAPAGPDATRVSLIGLDDDNQGRRTDVLWELELGARVLDPRAELLGEVERLDAPRTFGAYYNALRWNRVTATDARLFQAPFRAGVKLMLHQLTPLKRALDLPRANLFIADDVGLGKTIEAGLVLQELLLRNQVELVVIIAPASVCPQWQREMATRFGLGFELYNRAFVQRRRQDRGFGVNPWLTHSRFVISYQTLRRPEYEAPLHAMLAEGERKTLLILDEAHTAAPASSTRYAVPSDTTRVIQQLAPRFDHRLFLSATPHNGHSNSFSTLLSLLDRQRFTRGVKVDARALEQVMVRRLKSDLRALDQADGNLARLFGPEATQHPRRPFHEHFAWRTRCALARDSACDNPFLWQFIAGRFPDAHRSDWLQADAACGRPMAVQPMIHHGKMGDVLETMPPGSADLVHLSNILDWLDPQSAEETLRRARRVLKPGGRVILRQLNSTLDIDELAVDFTWERTLSQSMTARDRSFIYPSVWVGRRP